MRNLLLGAITLALANTASPLLGTASAEIQYPYCATGAFAGSGGCSYTTLEQCRASIQGNGGYCAPNPRYSAGAGGAARTRR